MVFAERLLPQGLLVCGRSVNQRLPIHHRKTASRLHATVSGLWCGFLLTNFLNIPLVRFHVGAFDNTQQYRIPQKARIRGHTSKKRSTTFGSPCVSFRYDLSI